jgi:hypothetical protein
VCLEASTKPHIHRKFEIFRTNIASTMARLNLKNGPKTRLRPLGVNISIEGKNYMYIDTCSKLKKLYIFGIRFEKKIYFKI